MCTQFTDAGYCYRLLYIAWSLFVLLMPVSSAKMAVLIKMPDRLMGAQGTIYYIGYIWVPPGQYS